MPQKNIWGLIWTAIICHAAAQALSVPSPCLVTSVQLLCASFYSRTIDKCISNSLPTDIFVKGQEICYVVFPERCVASDFCPQAAQVKHLNEIQTPHLT